MEILVVGGAGYIGSHMVKMLSQHGHQVTTLDNLSTGYKDSIHYGEFVEGDIADSKLLDRLFSKKRFDGVMHFASFIEVGESVKEPAKYYQNNFVNTLNLLNAMVQHNVNNFIFSSTAAIFGEPDYIPINEEHPKNPINPYGQSKLMVEHALKDYDNAYGLKSVCLRYFNAAGADPDGELGERHNPETHLIPLILQAASGRREAISVFGEDYDTPDGSCLRDYIHIVDLCTAHLLAFINLISGSGSKQYNLGNGDGFSVLKVIELTKMITGIDFNVIHADRREGDPAILVADSTLAKSELAWTPQFNELSTIIEHAWQWERKHFCK
ncbi:MAG: UDP-glucose 4-epimerase GalE [Gammaproteobacteria bacterium]|nr:UDP-glucose 4-epimerase GalE [Gammaproteobacteria bacterium]